jgi:muramoyltetrapeptide carboxypeptidase LdcA involved in peptidoglycan recycling
VSSHLKKHAIPVIFNFPAGHTITNKPFFIGAETSILVDEKLAVVETPLKK